MTAYNCPVEMVSLCSLTGELTPVRFRCEEADHTVCVFRVSEVISTREISHVGAEAMIFLCRADAENREHLMELKYSYRTHRWVLFRMIH